jgi:hypothetical protein
MIQTNLLTALPTAAVATVYSENACEEKTPAYKRK